MRFPDPQRQWFDNAKGVAQMLCAENDNRERMLAIAGS